MSLRIAGFAILCLSLALPAVGQIQGERPGFGTRTPLPGRAGGQPGAGPGGPGNPLGRLQDALELTPAQLASFEPLLKTYREDARDLREQIGAARETVRNLVDAGNDPTAIGNAVLAEHALQQELRSLNERLREDFKNLLTTDQREKLESIETLTGPRGVGLFRRGPRGL